MDAQLFGQKIADHFGILFFFILRLFLDHKISKHEARNSKQYLNSNIKYFKQGLNFGFLSFEFVSDLDIRYSDFKAFFRWPRVQTPPEFPGACGPKSPAPLRFWAGSI